MWPEGLIASFASDVEMKPILLILFILSVPLLFLDRIYRIEEDLSHAEAC